MIKGPKLIFIDEIVGCSESRGWRNACGCTCARAASMPNGLRSRNRATRCTIWATSPSSTQRPRARWRLKPGATLDERRASERITVLDATLLQASVRFFEFFAIPPQDWQPALTRLLQVAEPLAPALIYLHPKDPDRFMDWVAEIRGAEWSGEMEALFARFGGFAGMRAYYAERLKQDLALVEKFDAEHQARLRS